MTARAALLVLLAVTAVPVRAQESVFNLPRLGVPGTAESMRSRALGGAGLSLEGEPFSLESPAQLVRFARAGFYLSALGQRVDVDDGTRSAMIEDFTFPMAQVVLPAWGGTALAVGYYQFIDFDAAVESSLPFGSDTLPLAVRSEGGISVIAPAVAWGIDARSSAGVSLDVYLGSRRLVRQIETGGIGTGALTTVDSLVRDFRAVGFTVSAERRFGDVRISGAWHWRPTVDSRITVAPTPGLIGLSTEFDLPSEVALGASAPLARSLTVSASVRWSDWSSVVDPGGGVFGTAFDLSGGIELAPAMRRLWIFDADAPFRAGLRWRRLPLRVEGEPLSEWIVSAGYGRAFLGGWSRVDAVLEIGRRGELDSIGISERFVRFGLGLSAFEQWRRGSPGR